MTYRRLLVLVILAGVLVTLTAILYATPRTPSGAFQSGMLLLQGLDAEKVRSIVIRQDASTVTLVRADGGFTVTERGGYPAALAKINELIMECLEIRCAEKVTASRENHSALGVSEGADGAVSVLFKGEDGKPIVGLVKGKSASRGSGAYVRLADRDDVYISDKYLSLRTAPMDYIDATLLSVKPADVQKVSVQIGNDTYRIARGNKDTIDFEDLPEGKQVKGKVYERVFEALNRLDMTDVSKAGAEMPWDATYTCRTTNDITYVVRTAKKDEKYYLQLSAKGPAVESVTITRSESEQELKKKEAVLLAADTARKFNDRHAPWLYEASSWSVENLRRPLSELIEDIPKATADVEEITASHILVSYKEAQKSEVTRTKDEARARAEEALAKARAEGADFAAIAKEYSDAPTRENGGDLGPLKKGASEAAFEEAAFKLDVGQISDVIETPFGFQIIKRTK